MMQNVVAEDRADLGLSVVILKTADRKAEIMRVLAPLGVLLPTGLGLNIDKKDNGRAYFKQCFSDGCYAEVILEPQLLDTLRTGKDATFIVFATPEEGIGIPVDLRRLRRGVRRAAVNSGGRPNSYRTAREAAPRDKPEGDDGAALLLLLGVLLHSLKPW